MGATGNTEDTPSVAPQPYFDENQVHPDAQAEWAAEEDDFMTEEINSFVPQKISPNLIKIMAEDLQQQRAMHHQMSKSHEKMEKDLPSQPSMPS